MLDREELQDPSRKFAALRTELESLRRQLAASQARNVMWRSVIEGHLEKGCPSRSLRELLLEAEFSDDLAGYA